MCVAIYGNTFHLLTHKTRENSNALHLYIVVAHLKGKPRPTNLIGRKQTFRGQTLYFVLCIDAIGFISQYYSPGSDCTLCSLNT